MRKSLIAQSVAAAVCGLGLVAAAHAAVVGPDAAPQVDGVDAATTLVVNTDGIGHINLVPYFSAQAGNDTYVNIVNTDTRNGKAVKVRFRGASNSDDVFDFTLLMSPGDKFAFAITKDATTGLPMVSHADTSCTLGGTTGTGINAINGEKFVTNRVNPTLSADLKANETREGYVEILTMADIPPAVTGIYPTIKHVETPAGSGVWKAPCAVAALTTLATNPTDYADAQSKGLEVPTTGLMTNWTIINVAKAASYTGAATAVEARTAAGVAGYGNIVVFAQNQEPVVAADAALYTSDPLLNQAVVDAANYDFPDLSTPYLNSTLTAGILTSATATFAQASSLMGSLAVTSVANEFVTVSSIAAKTDWIFSLPTRRYNVARDYATPANVFTDLTTGPGTNYFTNGVAPNLGNVENNTDETGKTYQLCVKGLAFQAASSDAAALANRNGPVTMDFDEKPFHAAADLPPFVISPNNPAVAPSLKFCGEVSILKFNVDNTVPSAASAASVLGANVATKGLTLPFAAGWMRLSTPGLAGIGLPIIGSAVSELFNAAATPGVAGAYGQTFPHRATRPAAP